VSLTITPEKKYFVDKDEVAFDQIESKLLAETKKLGDNTVVVRIPFDAQVQELVDVLRIGMENDLKMIIATKSDS
jgi:biopolymer transport protein ExbD